MYLHVFCFSTERTILECVQKESIFCFSISKGGRLVLVCWKAVGGTCIYEVIWVGDIPTKDRGVTCTWLCIMAAGVKLGKSICIKGLLEVALSTL